MSVRLKYHISIIRKADTNYLFTFHYYLLLYRRENTVKKKTNTKKLVLMALVASAAMVLSAIEMQIPAFTTIPGVKIGFANIAVIFALYRFGAREAMAISFVRIVTITMLFGNASTLIYSLAGAFLSFLVMLLLKRFTPLSAVSVSVAGGLFHNVGQIITACLIMETAAIALELPWLFLSGTIAGIAVGVAASFLIKAMEKVKM